MRRAILFCLTLVFAATNGMRHLNKAAAAAVVPSSNLLASIGGTYIASLNRNPFTTNVITAAGLCVFSDSISQFVERRAVAAQLQSFEKRAVATQTQTSSVTSSSLSPPSSTAPVLLAPTVQVHNWYRSLCMSVYGAGIYGVLIIYWFRWLNHVVPQEGITPLLAVKKVVINQAVMSPLLNSLFFAWVSYTRDLSRSWNLTERTEQLKRKLAQDLLPTIKKSWGYWGVAQFVNFWWISRLWGKEYQLLYVNLSFVLWTTYLAYVGYRKVK